MDERGMQLAVTVVAVTAVKELIVGPCVRWLHRKGVLKGPEYPPFFSLLVRWRNIGIFLAFTAAWIGLIWGVPHLLGLV